MLDRSASVMIQIRPPGVQSALQSVGRFHEHPALDISLGGPEVARDVPHTPADTIFAGGIKYFYANELVSRRRRSLRTPSAQLREPESCLAVPCVCVPRGTRSQQDVCRKSILSKTHVMIVRMLKIVLWVGHSFRSRQEV